MKWLKERQATAGVRCRFHAVHRFVFKTAVLSVDLEAVHTKAGLQWTAILGHQLTAQPCGCAT